MDMDLGEPPDTGQVVGNAPSTNFPLSDQPQDLEMTEIQRQDAALPLTSVNNTAKQRQRTSSSSTTEATNTVKKPRQESAVLHSAQEARHVPTVSSPQPQTVSSALAPYQNVVNTVEVSSHTSGSGINVLKRNENLSKGNKYSETDEGPYYVFVESCNANIGRLHPMALGKLLYRESVPMKKDIIDVRNAGRNRIKVEMRSGSAANSLVDLQLFPENHMEAYIPRFMTTKQGVIKNVDVALTDEEIRQEITCDKEILNVRRYTKKINNNGSEQIVQQPVCVITFKSQRLPDYVYLYSVRCQVEPYVPPQIQCFICLQFNHRSSQCRGQPKCAKCSGQHLLSQCTSQNEPCCMFCQGKHLSTDRKCPEHRRLASLRRERVYQGLTPQPSPVYEHSYARVLSTPTKGPTLENSPASRAPLVDTNQREDHKSHTTAKHKIISVPRPRVYYNRTYTRQSNFPNLQQCLYSYQGPSQPIWSNAQQSSPYALGQEVSSLSNTTGNPDSSKTSFCSQSTSSIPERHDMSYNNISSIHNSSSIIEKLLSIIIGIVEQTKVGATIDMSDIRHMLGNIMNTDISY